MSGREAADDSLRVAVFASGSGSNFQALVDHARGRSTVAAPTSAAARAFAGAESAGRAAGSSARAAGSTKSAADAVGSDAGAGASAGSPARPAAWRPVLLVSDREGAGALDRARVEGVESAVVRVPNRPLSDVARDTLALLEEHDIDVLLLAGYLRLVPAEVVRRYAGRILNVHPALLPAFGGAGMYGMNVHRAVIEAGVRVTGATVHLVDEAYDRGRILAQWPVPVLPDDTPESVAARVLAVEHRLYPHTVDHASVAWAAGREPGPVAVPGESFRLEKGVRTTDASSAAGDHPADIDPSTDIEREAS